MGFFGGDFNFVGDNDLVLHTRGGAPRLERATARRLQRSWERALDSLIEMPTDDYTYYNLANATYSRIDKVFVRLPPWMVTSLKIQGAVIDGPLDLRRRGLSDHALYVVEVCPRSASTRATTRSSPTTPSACLLKLPALLAWSTYKVILRVAAESARRIVLGAPYTGAVPELVTLSSIARALWLATTPASR